MKGLFEFMFRSFWHWAGATFLLVCLLNGLVCIIRALRGCPACDCDDDDDGDAP